MGFRATMSTPKFVALSWMPKLGSMIFWGVFLFVFFKRVARRVKLYQTEGL